jgi:hypothetical protein
LDFDEVHGFLDTGRGSQDGGVDDTATSGDDLTTTSVNSISMESDIQNVETTTTQVFFGKRTFLGSPLESSNTRILDFVEVLDSLGDINHLYKS